MGPGHGLLLKNEWKPLEDLQMVRCKVSCPPPQSLGCKPHAPRLHSGGDSGLPMDQDRTRQAGNRDARDASDAVHGCGLVEGTRGAAQASSQAPVLVEEEGRGERATSSVVERMDMEDVRRKETGRCPMASVPRSRQASIACGRSCCRRLLLLT